jgi:gluconolactonase
MQIDVVGERLGFTEGPVWLPDDRVALTSISHGCVYIIDPFKNEMQRIDTGGGPNGLACGDDGTLYVAQNGGAWGASGPVEPGVQVITGTQVEYLVEGLGAPNDLAFGPDGRLWVTDTRGEFDVGTPGAGLPGHVYAVDVGSGETQRVVDDGPVFVNGLGFDHSGSRLLVTATLSSELLSYAFVGSGHRTVAAPEVVHTFDSGWPDGMLVSSGGDYWVALTGADRIDVIDTWGRRIVEIPLPQGSLPTNVCVGGRRYDELLVTASGHEALLRIGFDGGEVPPL